MKQASVFVTENIPVSDMLYKLCDVDGLIAVDRNGVKMKK